MKLYFQKIILILFLFFLPQTILANQNTEEIFQARVKKIIKEQKTTLPDGVQVRQQNIELTGLEGEYRHQQIEFIGIGDFDVIRKNIYKPGDRVLVLASTNDVGETNFYITDFVRINFLFYLSVIFIFVLIIIGGMKGVRSLLSLLLSFIIIIYFIIPQILLGRDPLIITLLGCALILLALIYITEGFRRQSHIAILSILVSLFLTIFLSKISIHLAHLSGLSSEDAFFLVNLGKDTINFQGLLLAGIIIGSLGVIDDVVLSQVSLVAEIRKANPRQNRHEIWHKAYAVGVTHISSMTNTLFLAYAGASLTLLIFFVSGESAFSSWTQIINNENIATEIIRALAGSIGLIFSVPISTGLAVIIAEKH